MAAFSASSLLSSSSVFGLEWVKEVIREHPYSVTIGALSTAIVTCVAIETIRAKPPEQQGLIVAPGLTFHPFVGHLPGWLNSIKQKQWLKFQMDITHGTLAWKAGLVSLCFPGLSGRYIHAVIQPDLIAELFDDDLDSDGSMKHLDHHIYHFMENGVDWKTHYQKMSTIFSIDNDNHSNHHMFEVVSRTAQRAVDMLKTRMVECLSDSRISTTVDLFDVIGRFTLDSSVEMCFGQRCESLECYPKTFEFSSSLDRILKRYHQRITDPLWKIKKWLNVGIEAKMAKDERVIVEFVNQMLNDMKHNRHQINERSDDQSGHIKHGIISWYIQLNSDEKKELNECDLRYIAMRMIADGREQTRSWLAWCLALLCTSQRNWLEKVRDEIQQISSSQLSYDDCQKKMRITECVLLETLRLYPSVLISGKQAKRDLTLSNGLRILKGDRIEIYHYSQARNPCIYGEDASEFKPMRWFDKGLNSFPPQVFSAFYFLTQYYYDYNREFLLIQSKIFLFYFLRDFKHHSVQDRFPQIDPYSLVHLIMDEGWEVEVTQKEHF